MVMIIIMIIIIIIIICLVIQNIYQCLNKKLLLNRNDYLKPNNN